MQHANKAKLEIYGDVDALSRIIQVALKMSEHGLSGHGFSVVAADGARQEKKLGYWDGHGANSLNRMKLTELKTGKVCENILCRSIDQDEDGTHHFEWCVKTSRTK